MTQPISQVYYQPKIDRKKLIREIASVLNRCSRENVSNTPDFILAEYMVLALEAFEITLQNRQKWYNEEIK